MDEERDDDLVPVMSAVGWYVVECIERMIDRGFTSEEICQALDIPTEYHLQHMLTWATREREELLGELL